MIKIGVITYWKADNYGAFLQAYALQTFLEHDLSMSVQVSFIDYKRSNDNYCFNVQESHFLLHREKSTTAYYDVIICGSDVIWDVSNGETTQKELFFGKVSRNYKKLIAYSGSVGGRQWRDFLRLKNLRYLLYLRRFDEISVRDDATYHLVKRLRKDIQRTLDPTFLISWGGNLQRIHRPPYVFVYGYSANRAEDSIIHRYAKKNGLQVISCGKALLKADETVTPDPFTWLSYFASAEFVFTSTFHGTVFSLLLNKEFIAFGRGSLKIRSLLSEFELNERNQRTGNEFQREIFNRKIDYDKVNRIIARKRKHSSKYLKRAITTK